MANYAVDPAQLTPLVPIGTELDLFKGDALVSLVAFQFLDTRVLGLPVPWHINFPEINLRFYLKRVVNGELRRGVAFISEIVPRHAITLVANSLFNEHYKTRPMSMRVQVADNLVKADYSFREKNADQTISCTSDATPQPIGPGSLEDFITEHYFGYTGSAKTKTLEYQVEHPSWRTHKINNYAIDLDFGQAYGDSWAPLTRQKPHSVLFAEGSEVNLYSGNRID